MAEIKQAPGKGLQKSVASPLTELSATLPPRLRHELEPKIHRLVSILWKTLFVVESGKISLHIPKSPKSDV